MFAFLNLHFSGLEASLFLLLDQVVGQLIQTVGSNGQGVSLEHTYDKLFILIQKHA